ncbi:NmrA/HSCARG family protein [Acidisoma silvae]|uniref:NmrA/HSCARG family protein n=1 Tax=Acidisoma silvae TaxID=2802396 RepID=A0A964DXI7_9PROT|nr:NmrA/HSCARG family protein [Acidisoma silvae]MCB8874246.1 NmrA/HSCARG family protein [Acidisoma silvae]
MATDRTVLVFGATGQQGGAVAQALRAAGWLVRALVRDTTSDKAEALRDQGVMLVQGDMDDTAAMMAAMAGVYGVFSVQPSSGQGAAHGVTDADEIRWGKTIADSAMANGVRHLVYTSVNAAGAEKTGMGHFDSKAEIEAYIRSLPLRHTIIRPSGFMEILMLPGMGLNQGQFHFLMRPDQPIQCIAVADIGRIVAGIFADPETYAGQTLEIAGDTVTGTEIAAKLSHAAGRPITYHRFADSLLEQNAFLARLAALVDDGRLAGNADIAALRRDFPGMLTMDAWLAADGKPLLQAALAAEGGAVALR